MDTDEDWLAFDDLPPAPTALAAAAAAASRADLAQLPLSMPPNAGGLAGAPMADGVPVGIGAPATALWRYVPLVETHGLDDHDESDAERYDGGDDVADADSGCRSDDGAPSDGGSDPPRSGDLSVTGDGADSTTRHRGRDHAPRRHVRARRRHREPPVARSRDPAAERNWCFLCEVSMEETRNVHFHALVDHLYGKYGTLDNAALTRVAQTMYNRHLRRLMPLRQHWRRRTILAHVETHTPTNLIIRTNITHQLHALLQHLSNCGLKRVPVEGDEPPSIDIDNTKLYLATVNTLARTMNDMERSAASGGGGGAAAGGAAAAAARRVRV